MRFIEMTPLLVYLVLATDFLKRILPACPSLSIMSNRRARPCPCISYPRSLIIIPMQSLSDDERKEVLGEVLHDELQAILELVKDVPSIKQELHQVHTDVDELKQDMKVVKAAIIDLSNEQRNLDSRVSRLEST